MKPLYFSAIATAQVAQALTQQVHESLRPFVSYLNAAKHAAREREARSWVGWKPVPFERTLRLEPIDSLLELSVEGHSYQVVGWQGPPPDMPLFIGDKFRPVQPRRVEQGADGPFLILGEELVAGEAVWWAGQKCALRPMATKFPDRILAVRADEAATPIRHRFEAQGRQRVVVEGPGEVSLVGPAGERLVHRVLTPEDGATQLRTPLMILPWNGERTLVVATLPDEETLTADNAVRWRCSESAARRGRERGVWIALSAVEGIDGDVTIDPRAAYCEEGVREVRTQKGNDPRNIFKVFSSRRDSYRLELDRLPPEGSKLFLPANLNSFNQQLNAVHRLKDGPLPHHRALLRLTEAPELARWPPMPAVKIADDGWFLLGNLKWDGTNEQRDFVQKALRTPDFAFLEGPPGSGKTHAICELVLQLIAENQRVLLCSTTHVAVDNVLERLAGPYPQVEAVRIGKADRIDAQVLDCQLDARVVRLRERWRSDPAFAGIAEGELETMAEGTVLASANLTCGTTTGILRHPYLSGKEDGTSPSWPHFDVLIIDEASKTTLQEFLVPAQLARRWIIVGDVRQLPPFTEPKDLEASLAEISEDAPGGGKNRLQYAYQRACLLLFELDKDEAGAGRVRWLLDEPKDVLEALVAEMAARAELGQEMPCVVRIVDSASSPYDVTVADLNRGTDAALKLLAAHWVLVPTDILPTVERFLTADLVRLRTDDALAAFPFRHQHWAQRGGRLEPPVKVRRGSPHLDVKSLLDAERTFFKEQSWAKQVAWRLGRVHQLGSAKSAGDRDARQQEIERLLPVAPAVKWVAPVVDAIRDVGVRSVIEALRIPRAAHRVRRRSALTEAIPKPVWDQRSLLLTRQHRMHPDISVFPRGQFYDQAALIDANTLEGRDAKVGWSFRTQEPGRRVWIDVAGHEERGCNPEEVRAVRRVLEEWKRWASASPRKDGKPWEIACLSFYNKQELALRDMLREVTGQRGHETRFELPHTRIVCATVDRFQGREADLVLLSFRNVKRPGHADSPNRLNVAITRARFLLMLVGNKSYFEHCPSDELAELAKSTPVTHVATRRS